MVEVLTDPRVACTSTAPLANTAHVVAIGRKLAEETEKEFSALKRTLVLLPRPRPALGSSECSSKSLTALRPSCGLVQPHTYADASFATARRIACCNVSEEPGRMRGGEMYYGRQWCDMTRALDEQGLSSVDRNKDAVKDGVVEWHGRSYSDMSRQVAIYEYVCSQSLV